MMGEMRRQWPVDRSIQMFVVLALPLGFCFVVIDRGRGDLLVVACVYVCVCVCVVCVYVCVFVCMYQ